MHKIPFLPFKIKVLGSDSFIPDFKGTNNSDFGKSFQNTEK